MAGEHGGAPKQLSTSIPGLGSSPLRGREIRLLRILPGESSSPIRCEVTVVALDGRQTYTALSYAWGNPPAECAIFLNGREVKIRKNLWRFLHQARSLSEPLFDYIWIDALCVDQTNDSERTHQVALMGEIYATAERVIAWLGPAHDSSDLAIEDIRSASPQWTAKKTLPKKWVSPAASGIRSICVRRYWKRLWIFQELLLARQAVLLCGSRYIPINAFRDFILKVSSCNVSDHAAEQFELQRVRKSPAMNIMQYIAQRSAESSILDLLIVTRDLRCSDIRDRVFAVLSVDAGPTRTVSADYEKSVLYLVNDVLRDHHNFQRPTGLDDVIESGRKLAKIMNIALEDVFTVEDGDSYLEGSTSMPKPSISHTSSTNHVHANEVLLDEPATVDALEHSVGSENGDGLEAESYGGRLHGRPVTFIWAAYWHHGVVVDCLLREGVIDAQACLAEAIKRDHYTAVTVLLKANAAQLRRHIDEPISQCANALQFAVAYRRSKIVDLLLREGANVNARGAVFDQETTAQAAFATNYVLKIATINQSRDLVELLLAKGARVNATCRPWAVPSGSTSLGAALQSRRVDIARLLLDAGADINSEFTLTTEATVDMYKLLSAAVKDGAEDESQILLQLGGYDHRCWPAARWYIRYDAERSLLEQAVLFRHCGIVRLLLEHKVPVNDADGVNCNALSIAITLGELEIARLLLKYGANANMSPSGTWKTPLCAAVTRQSEDMTELLLRNGAKPDLSPKWLPTALHIAVGLGSEALVRTLLWHGAEVARPFNNRTPISKAIQYGYANIAKVLFQAGAKATSSMLYDVIQIRTSSERELIIALIIEHGADLNAKEGYMERGALEEAVAVGNPRVVEILLRFKPTLDYSLLITAVRSNNSGIVKLLLRAGITAQSSLLYEHIGGASKTARLSEDFVGRESLSESGAIIQFMLEHGVDVDAREGRYKQTALELAIEKGNSEAIDILLRFAPQIKPTTLERASAFKGPEYPAIMRLLIDHCVRFATGKKLRSTALKFAARTGNLSALQSLLQSGTRVNSEIWNAARTCRHGTDSPHEQAVLQLLHDHEAATDDSGRHLFPISLRTTSVATERTGLLAHDFAEIENEQDDSVPVSQVDEPLACIALFG